jgi:hypothetical protein
VTIVNSDDELGQISFQGSDGTEFVPAAQISAFVDGTPGANDMPGRIVFSTTADGASSPTGRMVINSEGSISCSARTTTLTQDTASFSLYNDQTNGGTDKIGYLYLRREGVFGVSYSSRAVVSFGRYSSANTRGNSEILLRMTDGDVESLDSTVLKIRANGEVRFTSAPTTASAANAFLDSSNENRLLRSTSSLRYKTDIENIEHERADAVLNFRPVWYRSLANSDRNDWSWYGLIAEEVAVIEPRLVHWTYLDDAYDITYETVENEDGTTVEVEKERTLKSDAEQVPDGVQYDRLTVLLLDVVQRQQKAIEVLEAKVKALENS